MRFLVLLITMTVMLLAQDVKQIYAFEGAYNGLVTQKYATTTPDNTTMHTAGFKLGAKENNMRLFVSYRYLFLGSLSGTRGHSGGAELDYFLDMGMLGVYVGPVGGWAIYDFTGADTQSRTLNSPYVGANVGATLRLGSIEIEGGARYWYYLNGAVNTVSSQLYTVQDTMTLYAALNLLF